MIELINVSKFYKDQEVFSNLSFYIKEGTITQIYGPLACGKSTSLKLICGLERPTAGEIKVFGEIINTSKYSRLVYLRRHMGVVLDDFGLLEDLNVKQNLYWVAKLLKRKQYIEEAIDFFGINNLLHKKIYQLSSSEKYKVVLTRILAIRASIVLLDEPFAYYKHSDELIDYLKKLNDNFNMTIVFTTFNYISNFDVVTLGGQCEPNNIS